MKNRLIDLNNHLFSQLERLCEENLSAEDIEREVKRADAIVSVSEQIVKNSELTLKAATLVANHGDRFKPMLPTIFRQPDMIEGKVESQEKQSEKSEDK